MLPRTVECTVHSAGVRALPLLPELWAGDHRSRRSGESGPCDGFGGGSFGFDDDVAAGEVSAAAYGSAADRVMLRYGLLGYQALMLVGIACISVSAYLLKLIKHVR